MKTGVVCVDVKSSGIPAAPELCRLRGGSSQALRPHIRPQYRKHWKPRALGKDADLGSQDGAA